MQPCREAHEGNLAGRGGFGRTSSAPRTCEFEHTRRENLLCDTLWNTPTPLNCAVRVVRAVRAVSQPGQSSNVCDAFCSVRAVSQPVPHDSWPDLPSHRVDSGPAHSSWTVPIPFQARPIHSASYFNKSS